MNQKILFICTGNYYSSRFAEMLFNAEAVKLGLRWRADSRGIEPSIYNIGPIYMPVLRKLEKLRIPVETKPRMPIQLKTTDLEEADLVIALDATEHRLWMKQRFAEWADEILYWNIPDLDLMDADKALTQIERNVNALIQQLQEA